MWRLLGHHVDMAEEHSALLVALEHRFYGDSINPEGLETENLSDLSSQQAWEHMLGEDTTSRECQIWKYTPHTYHQIK